MACKRSLGCVVFLLAFMSVGWGDQDCKITGRVVDPAGAIVPNTSIVVYTWNQAPLGGFTLREVGRFVTDNLGEFHGSFAAGSYEILAANHGFLPTAARVKLTSAATTTVSLQLRQDPSQPIEGCCDATVPTVPN